MCTMWLLARFGNAQLIILIWVLVLRAGIRYVSTCASGVSLTL